MKQTDFLNLRFQIAKSLGIRPNLIKSIEEWNNCYFVTFVFGRPKFVSKRVVKPVEVKPTPNRNRLHTVVARTEVRNGWYLGSKNRGLLVRDTNGEESWINHFRLDQDIQIGDQLHYDGFRITQIPPRQLMAA